jgi:hypothetical protein
MDVGTTLSSEWATAHGLAERPLPCIVSDMDSNALDPAEDRELSRPFIEADSRVDVVGRMFRTNDQRSLEELVAALIEELTDQPDEEH